MSPYAVIAAVCVVGIAVEALRVRRHGQLFLAPGPGGRYHIGAAPALLRGRTFVVHMVPPLPLGPAFRFGSHANPRLGLPVSREIVEQAREDLHCAQTACRRILPVSWLMFLYLVVLVPATLLLGLVPHGWVVLGCALLLVQAWLLTAFWLAHRQRHPEKAATRIHHLVSTLLFPPAGVFACDRLVAEDTSDIHPLTAALVLLPTGEARSVVEDQLRRWIHPLAGDAGHPDAGQCAAVAATVRALDPGFADLLAPPEPHGPTSVAWCPRCLAQFTSVEGTCSDCTGLARLPFRRKVGASGTETEARVTPGLFLD